MTALTVTIDCADPARLAEFWSSLLGYQPVGAAAQYVSIGPAAGSAVGPKLIFQAVPEPKVGKNRLHLDVDLVPGADLDGEVQRAQRLGAAVAVEAVVEELGERWKVMTDPEGNEFCIVARSD